jgi:hypothetical protein
VHGNFGAASDRIGRVTGVNFPGSPRFKPRLVSRLVRQSGGQVRLYSEMAHGTTVCLYLPRFSGAAEADRPAELEPELEPGQGETGVGSGLLEPGMQVIIKPFPMMALALRVREIIES